jgi:hypothetical protein
MTRKYQTEQKTTTPEGKREYQRLLMRDRMRQIRTDKKMLSEKIKALPEYQRLSVEQQKQIDVFVYAYVDKLYSRMIELEVEVDQYLKVFEAQLNADVKRLVDLLQNLQGLKLKAKEEKVSECK